MHVVNLAGASSVQDYEGNLHTADEGGVFTTLPLDFAQELVTRHASHWREASAHEAAQRQARVEDLRNPHVLPTAVAKLREDLDAALARLDTLEKQAKPQRPAPAKKTAAKAAQAKPAE